MTAEGTYRVRIDPIRNRLYVELRGALSEGQILSAVDDVIVGVGQLKPGFSVVNDLTTFKPTTPKGAEDVRQAQAFVARQPLGRVIHVMGQDVSSDASGVRTGRATVFAPETATSIAEAEALLDRATA